MAFLLDTMVLSEVRKRQRCAAPVAEWFDTVPATDVSVSVIVLGEIRRGIEVIRPRDPSTAAHLDDWLQRLRILYAGRILDVTEDIAERWGRISPNAALGTADGLIAATALHHGLTVATRNVSDFARSGVAIFNPWEHPLS